MTDTSTLKKTPLSAMHEKSNARMVDFSGWYMPVQYTTVIEEHLHTRSKAGLFDISHMGEIEIRGAQAQQFLQALLTVDLGSLSPDRCMYALICLHDGGTVDDSFVYCFSSTKYWLVVNAANTEKDIAWLREHASHFNVSIRDISDETAKLDLQGPLSENVLASLSAFPMMMLERFDIVNIRIANIPVMISRTGYTGEDGFEIYFSANQAESLWTALIEKKDAVKAIGLGARDTLRIEACYSLYGHELSEEISPIEAGLGWAVHDKQEDYPGKDMLLTQKKKGTARKLVYFIMDEKAVPRAGYEIYFKDACIGHVTSGTYAPTLEKMIGMGLVSTPVPAAGEALTVKIRDKLYGAKIVKRPFYSYKGGTD
ncbi:MAG: glycine cleavage system aminomethyltransferase GcvT [Spirochaetaceae bacterium]|nr:MAG: glycine cleavage system aminomethyltransferase GcvT [Spirochaetaceae bacterium]